MRFSEMVSLTSGPVQPRSDQQIAKRKPSLRVLRVIYSTVLYQGRSHPHRATPGAAPHLTHFTRRPSSTRLAPTDCGPFEPRPEVWPVWLLQIPFRRKKKDGKPINVYVLTSIPGSVTISDLGSACTSYALPLSFEIENAAAENAATRCTLSNVM